MKKAIKKIEANYDVGSWLYSNIFYFILPVLHQPLTKIFNLILSTSYLPASWRVASICPVNARSDINNNCPVAIVCKVERCCETLLHAYIGEHTTGLISDEQHGFLSCKSTVTNLSVSFRDALWAEPGRYNIHQLFKTFDRLVQGILIIKLSSFGFSEPLITLRTFWKI